MFVRVFPHQDLNAFRFQHFDERFAPEHDIGVVFRLFEIRERRLKRFAEFADALIILVGREFIGIDAVEIVANPHAKLLFIRIQLDVQGFGKAFVRLVVLLDDAQIFVMPFQQQRQMREQKQMMLDERGVLLPGDFTRRKPGKAGENLFDKRRAVRA